MTIIVCKLTVSFVHISLAGVPADLLTRHVTGDDWSAFVRERICRPQYRQHSGKANLQPRCNHLALFPLIKLASAYIHVGMQSIGYGARQSSYFRAFVRS
jgi:hypothetical protein